jgi:O-succinylbenzoate synthase
VTFQTVAEPIHIYEYLLRSGSALNSASQRRVFPGALLRVGNGYGCLHPWPEFGDLPLPEQLARLAAGQPTPLAEHALRCAAIDGAAREAGVSLFDGLEIPVSHYSWSFAQPTQPQLEKLLSEGWPALKAKGFANYGETTRFLEQCARVAGDNGPRFRVDFNGCLTADSFQKFVEFMSIRVYRQLDFVEDPFPYEADAWQACRERWGVKLALDKGWKNGSHGFDAVIVKPARRDWRTVAQLHPQRPLVLTSAMDHPLGQMFAAWEAAQARAELGDQVGLCGLCTQHLFEPDAFLERVLSPGGRLQPDRDGGGLGFGSLLDKLPWRRLE